MPFFNYHASIVPAAGATRWQRRGWLNAWWSLYSTDDRWTPPAYADLSAALDPRRNAHLARLDAAFIQFEALYRTGLGTPRPDQPVPLSGILEQPVSAAVVVVDPRRKGKTAHLALPALVNDPEVFERLYYRILEDLSAAGYRRLIGPTGLSPHLGSGVLVDGWDRQPPLHTPSNPPYTPDLLGYKMQAFHTGRLYETAVPVVLPAVDGPAQLASFDPTRLAGDLLPLLAAATENALGFPPPDAVEAAFLLRWLRPETLHGVLAEVDGAPVGFALLCADAAARYRATRGGRRWPGRARLGLTRDRPASRGRLVFGGVLPAFRRRGIGRQLLAASLQLAGREAWTVISIGPVAQDSAAAAFLLTHGATAAQTYALYEASF
jgi:GNAT superfamily N-acetyltransferase